jgi:phenylacetate-CoA ligase
LWSRPVSPRPTVQLASWAKYRIRNYVQFDTFQQFDDRKVDRIIAAIRKERPRHIYGYGSSIGRVAARLDARGEALSAEERPLLVEYTADHLHPAERAIATRVFGAPVISSYGASECGGVSQECRSGRLHVSVDHAVVEILRRDGSPAEPDEIGEIVLTTLHNGRMPLIRYRIGDLGAYTLSPCDCGVTLPLMSLQAGKAVDLVTTSTADKVSAHLFDYINLHLMKSGVSGVKQFLVEQTGLDQFVLKVVRDQPFDPRSIDLYVDRMKGYLGSQISVRPEFVDDIELAPSGKRRYFRKSYVD